MRRYLALWAILLCLASAAWGQPSVDDVQTGTNDGTTTTTTTGTLTPSGSNRAIYMCFTSEGSGHDNTITGVTYAGSESGFAKVDEVGTVSGFMHIEVWYLPGPVAASGTVVVTHTTSGATIGVTAIALSNVEQSTPSLSDTEQCTSSCDTTFEATITTGVDNTLLVACGEGSAPPQTFTHGAGQTERSDFDAGGGHRSTTSSELKVSAGSETLSSTVTGTTSQSRYVGIGIAPAAAAASTRRRTHPLFIQ